MKTYLTYPTSSDLNCGIFHKDEDNYKKSNIFNNFSEFESLTHEDMLIYLIPSNLISSYIFKQNKTLSSQNNLANFIAEIEGNIVNDVSDNEFFLINNIGFVMDKLIFQTLNESLSSLKCKTILLPDYFLNNKANSDSITEFNNKFLIAFSDGTGTSISKDSLEQYIHILKKTYPDFNPVISIKNSEIQKLFQNHKTDSVFNIKSFIEQDVSALPNLFKFNISIKSILKKLNFSKTEIYICTFLLISIFALPYSLIAINNNYINTYKDETFKLFKLIDKNTKRVVTPRIQIDQLIQQVPVAYNPQNNVSNFSNLEFLTVLGDKFIEKVEIDFATNSAILNINNMPEMQYSLIKGIAKRFDVAVINEDITFTNNLSSGSIKIEFKQ
jgi:hypothetical protein